MILKLSIFLGRLDVLRNSLEYALGSDELSSVQSPSTAEPSPRLPRSLPRLPVHDVEEVETSPSVTRRGAMSPSMASVTSGSTTASGVEGQRRLEWDSGADLDLGWGKAPKVCLVT